MPPMPMTGIARRSGIESDCETSPLISVVITSYNHVRYIAEAIESALNQTLPPSEIIVVDDGSTDYTDVVVARYPSVEYLRQANMGLAAARNTGWRASSAPFLVFLDADDLLHPEALEAGLREMLAQPGCGFVFGGYRYIDTDRHPLSEPVFCGSVEDHYAGLLRANYITMHATVLYRRCVLERVAGFDPSMRACEDYDLYLRIAREFPIRQHRALVADYRRHEQNMSHDAKLMLSSALAALGRQKSHVVRDSGLLSAYRSGQRHWRENFGRKLLRQSFDRLFEQGFRLRTVNDITFVLRHAPWVCCKVVAHAVGRQMFLLFPSSIRSRLTAFAQRRPAIGRVRFGDLKRLNPISDCFGFDRGIPIDRYYIEAFLERHASDIFGRVLEIGDNAYTRRFGGDRVRMSDVLSLKSGEPQATFVGDLATADHLPSDAYDCIVLTQTLQFIFDLRTALATLERVLKPSGVILATMPGVSRIERVEWKWCWSFTTTSAERLFAEFFPYSNVAAESHGNVLAATSFLQGIASSELSPAELKHHDPYFPVVIAVRAIKHRPAVR